MLQNHEYFELDYNLLLKEPETILKNLFAFLDLNQDRIPSAIRLIHQGLKHHNADGRKWITKSDPVLVNIDGKTFECVKKGDRYHLHYEGNVENIQFLNLPILIHSLEFFPDVHFNILGYEGVDGRLIFLTSEDKIALDNAPESFEMSFVIEQWYEKAIWGLRYFIPNTADWKWTLSTITETGKSIKSQKLTIDYSVILDFTIPDLVQHEWIPLNDAVIFEIMNRKECPNEIVKIIEKEATWVGENYFYFFSPPRPIIFFKELWDGMKSLDIKIESHGHVAKEKIFWLINSHYHKERIEYHETLLKSQQNLENTQNQLFITNQELHQTYIQLKSTQNQLNATLNSVTFKTGRIILFPLLYFYNLYRKLKK
jgi:hypothetical protein